MSVFGSDGGGDWDLRAVVRGCNMSMDDVPHTCFSPLMSYHHLYEEQQEEVVMNVADDDHDLIFGNLVFPEYLFADLSCSSSSTTAAGAVTATNNHNNSSSDLLISPFYNMNNSFSFSPQSTSSDNNLLSDDQNPQPDHVVPAADDPCSKPVGAKYRRRKNQQHKRVVMEVTADGLCSDMWAWRKYGQKPIKGSPYPRSYYRCSSSRGCPARKQVERSTHHDHDHDHDHSVDLINTNNNNNSNTTFIITYTAEHNHSKPTRRNSLAGTTRQRFSTPSSSSFKPTATAADHEQDMMIKKKMKKNIKIDNDRSSLTRPVLLPKKTEMEAAGDHDHDHQVKEITIINHDHLMMMNDFDFDQDQLNAAASGDLQFHPNEGAHMTRTNFW